MLETAEAGSNPPEPSPLASHHRVLASAAILGGTTVLVKLAAFAKDWLVARQFGASDQLDAFLVAFLIPSFVVSVLAQSFAAAFLPTYIRVFERQGPAAAKRLVSSSLIGGCAVLLAMTLLLIASAQWVLPLVGKGFDAEKLALTRSLFYVLSGLLIVSGISGIFSAVLNACEHFKITAFAPIAIPLCTITVFWTYQDRLGILALAIGTLLGFALESLLLGCAMARYGLLPRPRWSGLDANLRHVGSQYLPIVVGAALMSSSAVVDQSMAASLGSGQVSILSYGNKIVALLLTMVAVSLSTVLFPRFSRMIHAGRWDELKRALRGYTQAILLASIPVVAMFALFSEPLVKLIFERGAFTPETTSAVAHVQVYYLLQTPFYVLGMLGVRLLHALDANQTVLRITAMNLVLNVAGNYLFMHWFGVAGIAMSTSLMYFISCMAILASAKTKLAEASLR